VAGWVRSTILGMALAGMTWAAGGMAAQAQLPMPGTQPETPNPLTDTTETPGQALLYKLEADFARDVAARGGAGFASWFAPDAVVLANGKEPVVGAVAIASSASWSSKNYQLTWTPSGAWMNPAGNTGYTWGHYEGHSKDANGNAVVTSGRYITVWGKQPDGSWKVEMDGSANEPAESGSCCKLPGK